MLVAAGSLTVFALLVTAVAVACGQRGAAWFCTLVLHVEAPQAQASDPGSRRSCHLVIIPRCFVSASLASSAVA